MGGRIVQKVKNKVPAGIQITAEQLLRDAKESHLCFTPLRLVQKLSS